LAIQRKKKVKIPKKLRKLLKKQRKEATKLKEEQVYIVKLICFSLTLFKQAEEISTQKEVDVANQQVNNLMNKKFLFKYSTNKLTPKLAFYSMVYTLVGTILYFHEFVFFRFRLRFLFVRIGNILLSPRRYRSYEPLSLFLFNIITSNFRTISGIIDGECTPKVNENK
jgi:hypothetical protein